ncbi:MAG TPA: hypothetical protein VF328_20450, partial [Mycobacterium sp.]
APPTFGGSGTAWTGCEPVGSHPAEQEGTSGAKSGTVATRSVGATGEAWTDRFTAAGEPVCSGYDGGGLTPPPDHDHRGIMDP